MPTHEIVLTGVVLAILILSLGIHEAAHAYVAHRCGDDTAKNLGRLTLNPIAHIDPFMTVLLPLFLWISTNGRFVFGGARPVPVNPYNLRHPSRDMAYVALAGPISNFLLAILFIVLWKVIALFGDYPADALIYRAMFGGVMLNVFLAVFNLIPIPPLDGSRVVMHLLPDSKKAAYASVERFGFFVLLAILWGIPGATGVLASASMHVVQFLWDVTGGSWA
ncbi:MAG TPA: site-2 protease family protein [Planctomycetota bacterium]|mgnify:CR=1 FL=1|nr:site-2 protease family protein [Planctomycetota bacterium]HPF12881.1 site-2 protease family protein [Planctomycetota bacterium]HRV79811.1 site-2 protease family protein [Planctomycetota bacterium]